MRTLVLSMLTIFLLGTGHSLTAQTGHYYTNEEGVAIKGYDVVSYHKSDQPKKGDEAYSYEYDGATFYFANARNKKAFAKNPQKYLPQYGGYCAFAMGAQGKKVHADPENYSLEDGKLYLFFNGEMDGKQMNTKRPWMEKKSKLRPSANSNWAEMTNKE